MSRLLLALGVSAAALSPALSGAQTPPLSSLVVAHPILSAGQRESVTVLGRDLSGSPLVGASVTLAVRYTGATQHVVLPPTNFEGRTSGSFSPPASIRSGSAQISAQIANGYLRISLTGHFSLGQVRPPAARAALNAVARILPATVIAPAPAWAVVYVSNAGGLDVSGAKVTVEAAFREGPVYLSSPSDAQGVATIRLDTTRVLQSEKVPVRVTVLDGSQRATATSVLAVTKPAPTARPTAAPTVPPTPSAAPTPTAFPTLTPIPTATPRPAQIFAPSTNTPVPTSTPVPTNTPVPTDTLTPIPTNTPVPTPTSTPLPTNTPYPTATPTPTPNCPASQDECIKAMLDILNSTRAQYGASPLTLNMTQTNGTSTCVGSIGHSQAMAQSGQIWHQNANYPNASFPRNICVSSMTAGENVGQYSSSSELNNLQQMNTMMMNEPHDPNTCGSVVNHACNIIDQAFRQVGIGIYQTGQTTWLTEDFVG